MADTEPKHEDAGTLHQRLRFIVSKYSQAEVARRTGTSRQNVNRYVRGAKAPLEFGAILAKAFGINPVWLLLGEGTPYLADITAGTAKTAAGILDLVHALNTIARLRLGALAGKQHARSITQLGSALAEYERLRETLNAQTKPILQKLLQDLRAALSAHRTIEAEAIDQAAGQAARLCTDETLNSKLMQARAFLAHSRGDNVRACEYAERVFLNGLIHGEPDDDFVANAHNYLSSLYHLGRIDDARRIANAALALFDRGEMGGSVARYRAQFEILAGSFDTQLGDLVRGITRILLAYPHMPPGHDASNGILARAALVGGVATLHSVTALTSTTPSQVYSRVMYACFREDWEQLDALNTAYLSGSQPHLMPTVTLVTHAQGLLRARAPATPQARRAIQDVCAKARAGRERSVEAFEACAFAAQTARIAGEKPLALKTSEEADRRLQSLPAGYIPRLLPRAIHHQTILACVPQRTRSTARGELRARAQAFFDWHVAQGYRGIEPHRDDIGG